MGSEFTYAFYNICTCIDCYWALVEYLKGFKSKVDRHYETVILMSFKTSNYLKYFHYNELVARSVWASAPVLCRAERPWFESRSLTQFTVLVLEIGQ